MAKQRDWMDWVNTGANVLQTAQLSEVKGHLATLAKTETQREQRAAFHRVCREFLIEMDGKIDELMESAADSPKSAYAAAHMLQQRFERQEFTPSLFDDWGDIDRAKAVVSKLSKLITNTAVKCDPAWVNQVAVCVSHQAMMVDLEKLVAHAEDWDRLRLVRYPLVDELKRLEATLPTLSFPKSNGKLFIVSLVVLIVALGVFLVCCINSLTPVAMTIWPYVLGVFLLSAVLAVLLQPKTVMRKSERGKALARIAELKGRLAKSSEQELFNLAEKFGGNRPSSEFIALLDNRKQRIAALFDSERNPEPADGKLPFKR